MAPQRAFIAVTHLTLAVLARFQMRAEGFRPTHSVVDGRELIQLWGPSPRGPHVDVWMWAPGAPGQVPSATNMPLPPVPTPGPDMKQWTVADPPVFYTGDIVA